MGIITFILKAILKERFYKLQLHTKTLSIASKRSDLPIHTRLLAAFVTIYILSPIDLIPSFVPVIGVMDDILLIPIALILAIKMIPDTIMKECRCEAEQILGAKKQPNHTSAQ
ncbi:YkvA family protein [Methanolobus sp. WCC4]|uniref:YkvA family protein n=1 Tax=Methanolobus sp. WCC4 TaxID=3125784 RepID=UPI0030F9E555